MWVFNLRIRELGVDQIKENQCRPGCRGRDRVPGKRLTFHIAPFVFDYSRCGE